MTLSTVLTWNLVFKGVIGGLITSLITLIYPVSSDISAHKFHQLLE